ncbi:MAG TPA: FAD-dependent oxidoreductase [Acidimicrobiales bacterium]|nr:FAD-dependent oxidoreductase [Acidimicrobiales bacterium]
MHVVIGAGPTGLALGWALRRSGLDVVVLEAGDHVGGTWAGVDVGGTVVDLGDHHLDASLPAGLRAEVESLVELQEHPCRERFRAAGRWVPRAPSVLDALRHPRAVLGASGLERAAAWKQWGTDPSELVLPPAPARRRPAVRRPTVLCPRGGSGALVDALAAAVPVETGRRVTRLIEQDDRVVVGTSGGRIISAAHVHATLPPWQVTEMLGLHREARPPRRRGLVLVHLALDRPAGPDLGTHLIPARHLLPLRVSEAGAGRGAPSVLRAEVPCWPGDDVWEAGDAALVRRVADDLVRCGLPDPRPVAVHVARVRADVVPTRSAQGAWSRALRALSRSARVTVTLPEASSDLAAVFAAALDAARSRGAAGSVVPPGRAGP